MFFYKTKTSNVKSADQPLLNCKESEGEQPHPRTQGGIKERVGSPVVVGELPSEVAFETMDRPSQVMRTSELHNVPKVRAARAPLRFVRT